MTAFRSSVSLLAMATALFALSGCGSTGSSGGSLVRFFNAYIPATGADATLTITAGGTTFSGTNGLAFGQTANSGAYFNVSSGVFAPQGTGPGVSTPLQFPIETSLTGNNTAFTIVAAGQSGQTGVLTPQFYAIVNYSPSLFIIPTGSVSVRVVNFTVNPNPVGLYTVSGGTPTSPLATGLGSIPFGYNGASNPYVTLTPAQLTNLAVVDSSNPNVALSLSNSTNLTSFSFVAGQAYTLYIYGQPGNGAEPLNAKWILDYPAS